MAYTQYTQQEREILKENIKKIENYCETEILPLIDGYIYVDVSEMRHRKDGTPFMHSYSFYIREYESGEINIAFQSCAMSYHLDKNYNNSNSEYHQSIYEKIYAMEDFLLRWQNIKTKLLKEIDNRKSIKSRVLNFAI